MDVDVVSGLNGVDDAMQMAARVGTKSVDSVVTNVSKGE